MIVDEEQRFGVEHKEHITALRTHVDVLTLSATPIPRTLEMSLAGIREMSTITTPPEDRHPTLTYVGAYDEKLVAAAIRRELLRDGQVFYVHNRVSTSTGRPAGSASWCRGAGRRGARADERGPAGAKVNGFWDREFDVLVCTTIVENGLDISNANTLIVERADMLGLSQMHQLRGRVGRGRERGYAYFLYPPEHPLTETAHDRLATIAQNSELGAGMAVAMKDLEIRGAGNILGAEQSGHIAGVGLRPLHPAGRRGGGRVPEGRPGRGEGDEEESLPRCGSTCRSTRTSRTTTSTGERLRLEAYRKIAEAADGAALDAVVEELDRPLRRAAASRCATCSRSPRSGSPAGRSASRRSRWRATRSASRRSTCPTPRSCASSACYPRGAVQARVPGSSRCRGRSRAAGSAARPCATPPCWTGAPS